MESPTLTRSRFDVVHLHSGSSLRFFAHDRILHRPALRVAGQFLAGRCCWERLSLRPPLTRVIRRLLSSARRTGPVHDERSAPPGRSPLRERGSAHGILSFAVLLRRDQLAEGSASTHVPFARLRRSWAFVFPRTGRRVRIFLCAGQSRLVDCGSWVFRLASRTVPTRRDRPLLPWTLPLPGLSARFAFASPKRVPARVSTPVASHRFPAVCGPRRPPGCTAHPLMSLGLSPALQRVGETGACSDPVSSRERSGSTPCLRFGTRGKIRPAFSPTS